VKAVSSLRPEMIAVPKALNIPRMQVIDLDKASDSIFKLKKVYKRNPLFTLTDLENVPQNRKSGF
jgi:hypothetical protein